MIQPGHPLELSAQPKPGALLGRVKNLKEKLRGGERNPSPTQPYPAVDLVYWVPPGRGWVNFGDELSRALVSLMLARRGFTLEDETAAPAQLMALGSILHFAQTGAVVWGSGVNGTKADWHHTFTELDVRAVRGPYTQEFLRRRGITVPDVYGDPGLLTPLLVGDRFSRSEEYPVGVLHHFSDQPATFEKGVYYIDPGRSWNAVIADILKCSLIVSSSLHGVIVAEAFGIPARYFRHSPSEAMLKYRDYYEGTGRPSFSFATSVAEGVEMGGETPPVFDPQPLMSAFPYDLWRL